MKSNLSNIRKLQKRKSLNRNKYLKKSFSIASAAARNLTGGKCGCNKYGGFILGGKKTYRRKKYRVKSYRNKK